MTVYVDNLFATKPSNKWPYTKACHMFTDGQEAELHTLAAKLGLKRAWFQQHPTLWHYDLTPSKRALALRLGAQEIGGDEYKALLRRVVAERAAKIKEARHGLAHQG